MASLPGRGMASANGLALGLNLIQLFKESLCKYNSSHGWGPVDERRSEMLRKLFVTDDSSAGAFSLDRLVAMASPAVQPSLAHS